MINANEIPHSERAELGHIEALINFLYLEGLSDSWVEKVYANLMKKFEELDIVKECEKAKQLFSSLAKKIDDYTYFSGAGVRRVTLNSESLTRFESAPLDWMTKTLANKLISTSCTIFLDARFISIGCILSTKKMEKNCLNETLIVFVNLQASVDRFKAIHVDSFQPINLSGQMDDFELLVQREGNLIKKGAYGKIHDVTLTFSTDNPFNLEKGRYVVKLLLPENSTAGSTSLTEAKYLEQFCNYQHILKMVAHMEGSVLKLVKDDGANERTTPLNWDRTLNILIGIGYALHCVSSHLVSNDSEKERSVHCDLKLDNILYDKDFQPYLIDFGVCEGKVTYGRDKGSEYHRIWVNEKVEDYHAVDGIHRKDDVYALLTAMCHMIFYPKILKVSCTILMLGIIRGKLTPEDVKKCIYKALMAKKRYTPQMEDAIVKLFMKCLILLITYMDANGDVYTIDNYMKMYQFVEELTKNKGIFTYGSTSNE